MKIGVLAVQGAFREHERILSELGAETIQVRLQAHLDGLDGIVVPGGESTAIGRLMREYKLLNPLRDMIENGLPIFGTCAGMIVMANKIVGAEEPHLGVLNVEVNRNSFGRQKESFETDLDISVLGDKPFPAVFIRAPHVEHVGAGTEVICRYNDRVVAVQEGKRLAISFHPELTDDNRLHEYFLHIVKGQ